MRKNRKILSYMIASMLIFTSIIIITPSSVKSIEPPALAPSFLRVGDIMFIESKHEELNLTDIPGWDHVTMYTGVDSLFIESVPYPYNDGVQVTPMAVYMGWAADVMFGYVITASEAQRIQAVNFAMTQLGRPWQDPWEESWWANANPDDPDDPYSDEWMCAELIWAAYLHQGINIDVTPFPPPPEEGGDGIHLYVAPQDIADDDDVCLYANDDPPYRPVKPAGPTTVYRFTTHLYSTSAVDPNDDDIYYQWDWGESIGPWYFVPRGSGQITIRAHTWLTAGDHQVRVRAKDFWENIGEWSEPLTVTVYPWDESCFLAGTNVTMLDGSYKNIEDVEVGDLVKSYDLINRREIPGIVTKTFHHQPEEMTPYYLVINNNLRVTPNHYLYTDRTWVLADDIAVGDSLGMSKIPVTATEKIYQQASTYDLEIQPFTLETLFSGGGMMGSGGGGHWSGEELTIPPPPIPPIPPIPPNAYEAEGVFAHKGGSVIVQQ